MLERQDGGKLCLHDFDFRMLKCLFCYDVVLLSTWSYDLYTLYLPAYSRRCNSTFDDCFLAI
jgi:hypothetical protein